MITNLFGCREIQAYGGEYNLSLMVGKPSLLLCGNRKAPHRCGAFALPGRWSEGAVQLSVVLFLAGNNGCSMAALPLTSIRTTSKAGLLVSPVCGMVY